MSVKKSVKKASAKKTNGKTVAKTNGDGYKDHRPGSTKGKVHQMFDKLGPDKARVAVTKQKLCAPTTLNSWFSEFRKD